MATAQAALTAAIAVSRTNAIEADSSDLEVLDEEEEEEEQLQEAEEEQAAAASLVDTIDMVNLKDCACCTPVCKERFPHLTMTATARGFKNLWVCADRAACLQRATSEGRGRVRKAARHV